MATNPLPYEERKFIYTSETVQPDDFRKVFESGWKIAKRKVEVRTGSLPQFILTLVRPKNGRP